MKARLRHLVIGAGLVAVLAAWCPIATAKESSNGEQAQRMKWWHDARFGMFVHWGLYSGLAGNWEGKSVGKRGGMEWIQNRVKADTDLYFERAIPLFVPKQGFAAAWAKQAGCRYLVYTTKHHDGFALHDSKVSDFDAGTVLQRDLVREIVNACRAEGYELDSITQLSIGITISIAMRSRNGCPIP